MTSGQRYHRHSAISEKMSGEANQRRPKSLEPSRACVSITGMFSVPKFVFALLLLATPLSAAPKKKSVRLTAQQAEPYYVALARGTKLPDDVFRGVLNRLRLNLRSKTPGKGLQALVQRMARMPVPVIGPGRSQQLNFAANQAGALRAVYDEYVLSDQPVAEIRKHPSADAFPGRVPADAERITKTIRLDLRGYGKISTGLYAAPGEKVTVGLPKELTSRGLKAQIGLHSTRLSLDKFRTLKRFPSVSRSLRVVEITKLIIFEVYHFP